MEKEKEKGKYLLAPSFYAHFIQGLVILLIIIYSFQHIKSLQILDVYKKLLLLILLGVLIGIHSMSHLGLEYVYNFNPLSPHH